MRGRSPAALATAALAGLLVCSCATAPAGTERVSASDPAESLESARATLAQDSTNVESWFRVGLAFQRRQEPDSARAAYSRALEIEPGHVASLVHTGLVLEDLGRFDQALQSYDRAIEIAPEDPVPLVNKGSLLYFHFKRTYEAKTALSKAVELDPDNADAHFNLGVLFADAKIFREAAAEWETVLQVAGEGSARVLAEENLERIRPVLQAQQKDGSEGGP